MILSAQDDCYGVLSITLEEIAFLDEVCSGFYVGYDIVVLPQQSSNETEEVITQILEAIEEHR